jgi:hypothetical protein
MSESQSTDPKAAVSAQDGVRHPEKKLTSKEIEEALGNEEAPKKRFANLMFTPPELEDDD